MSTDNSAVCSYCGRQVDAFEALFTEDGPIHLGCSGLVGEQPNIRSRRRGMMPDDQAPAVVQDEYVRRSAHCYATLFHRPDKKRQVRPRYRGPHRA